MKKILFTAAIIISFNASVIGADYAFSFKKELAENNKIEKLSGSFYIVEAGKNEEDKAFFVIKDPVHQIITFEQKEMKVFYPEEKKLFLIPFDKNMDSGAFGMSVKKIDPAGMGFLLKKEVVSDTGITYKWAPKDIIRSKIKKMDLKYDLNDNLKEVAVYGSGKDALMRISYSDYFKVGDKNFPLFVEVYSKLSGISYMERMMYKPEKVKKIPDMIKSFKVPEDVVIISGKS